MKHTTNIRSNSHQRQYKTILSRCDIQKTLNMLNGLIAVKGGLGWVNWLLLVVYPLKGGLTGALARSAVVAVREFHRIYRSQGYRGLVLRTKSMYILTMQSVGGSRISSTQVLGPAIARDGSGLPRCIPRDHRRRIRAGDVFILRLWLSWFSIYRVLTFPSQLKLKTITSPSSSPEGTRKWVENIRGHVTSFYSGWSVDLDYIKPFLWNNPVTPIMLSTSTPTFSVRKDRKVSASVSGIVSAARLICKNISIRADLELIMGWIGCAWGWDSPWVDDSKLFDNLSKLSMPLGTKPTTYLGKLGFKLEAAGKVRVFAMVDCFTQWIMRPLHLLIFHYVLPAFPTDGTHDQLAPIHRLISRGKTRFWCYDLSAATDRLPISLQIVLLGVLLSNLPVAQAWARALVSRPYAVPKPPKGVVSTGDVPSSVHYAVGQPMGAYSSWAMLALTHHFIIDMAAVDVGIPHGEFTEYAVLGDDVVIADGRVAGRYLQIMSTLGVDINVSKSLVSRKGVLEFAKRFIVRGVDCSPVPFKEMVASRADFDFSTQFMTKYGMSVRGTARFLGFGYRVLGSLHRPITTLPRRLRSLVIYYLSPWGPHSIPLLAWIDLTSLNQLSDVLGKVYDLPQYYQERVQSVLVPFLVKAIQPACDLVVKGKMGAWWDKLMEVRKAYGHEICEIQRWIFRSYFDGNFELDVLRATWTGYHSGLLKRAQKLCDLKYELLNRKLPRTLVKESDVTSGLSALTEMRSMSPPPVLGNKARPVNRRSLLMQTRLYDRLTQKVVKKLTKSSNS